MKNSSIVVSAPGKIHLLGEHTVVYGKPALLAAVDLRTTVTLHPPSVILYPPSVILNEVKDIYSSLITQNDNIKKIVESIVKKHLKINKIPPYQLTITSQIPIGAGLGSSAAISASYIAALLSYLGHKWDLNLINKLTFEAEKVFHGNPSGADNTIVVYGGLISYTKGQPIQPLSFPISPKLTKNFILINTGKPKETTKEMVEIVRVKREAERVKFKKIFDHQEQLVKKLLLTIKSDDENQLIQIIRTGEKNLENIGVVSPNVSSIIRKIEEIGGAAKICGGGGKTGPTGVLLCYHPKPSLVQNIAKFMHLDYFKTTLGVPGLRKEN